MTPLNGTVPVELHLLGGFELTVNGEPIDMTPSAQRLLAFVALTPRGADRSFTAFQLWPEHDERRAKANLRSTLWRLGKVPAELVIATKTQLRLAPTVWVDARHGVAELSACHFDSIVGAVLPLQSLDTDLLPDWYDEWLMIERERLRQFRLGLLEQAAEHAIDQRRFATAVQLALAAVAVEPLRESGHRLVIRAHLANGNRFEAERQYRCYRTLMQSQMGCDPSPELIELVRPAADPLLVAV